MSFDYTNKISKAVQQVPPSAIRKFFDLANEMKIAAANAIAGIVSDAELNPEYILPDAFDKRVGPAVAAAVAQAARDTGVARI